MSWVHRCMIVPTEHAELARVLCEKLAGPGGSGMFTTPLSADGQEPATHYISSGMIEDSFADLLLRPSEQISAYAVAQGVSATPTEIASILDAVIISDEEAGVVLNVNGLVRITSPEALNAV